MSCKRESIHKVLKKHNLKLQNIQPMTTGQEEYFENYSTGKNQLSMGYPGTGKTYLAFYQAFQEMLNNPTINRITIVRSAIPSRDIGFLPGSVEEKSQVYELPYKKICGDLFGNDGAYQLLMEAGILRFMLTSYVRGLTLDNTIVILDELQNLTAHEADSMITRSGHNTKMLFCGDLLQSDFQRESDKNISKFIDVLRQLPDDFAITEFKAEDIVRSGLVKNYILKKQEMTGGRF